MSETTEKKNVQKLQFTIVDALEDVKAQHLVVYDTEHLSSLFERVIIASGTSNRQTKALAASVRDKVREAGFSKPRIEGEDNGEWIIVDCGAVVVHIMQPMIREYYHLEDIWGEKQVKSKAEKTAAKKQAVKTAATKALAPAKDTATTTPKTPAKSAAKTSKPKTTVAGSAKAATKKPAPKKVVAKKAAAPKVTAKKATATKASTPKPAAKKAAKSQPVAKKSATSRPAAKKTSRKAAA